MSGRVLALVDGSTHSDSVCRHTAWLASRLGATVDLLHALEPGRASGSGRPSGPQSDVSTGSPDELLQRDAQRARLDHEKARAMLDFASTTVQRTSTGFVNQRLWAGDLGANVAQFVGEFAGQTRAIVMGRRGRSGDGAQGRLGSQVERIVHASRDPVLVVSRTARPISRVALAFGTSAVARRVVEHVASSPVFRSLEVIVVHAGEDTADLRAHLDQAWRRLRLANLDVRTEVFPGDPGAVLQQVIEREGIELLVMGAYSHSRLRHLVVGSTTTAIMQACEVPILLVR
jgi:nucleotide-binding universal stress UspA family protein